MTHEERERAAFSKFVTATKNVSSVMSALPSFDAWIANKVSMARYGEMKQNAKPDCPDCRGSGYLPVFLPGDSLAAPCPCWSEEPRASYALAMLKERKDSFVPVRLVNPATRWEQFKSYLGRYDL